MPIYFIGADALDVVKIGFTAFTVETRLKQLIGASPVELTIVRVIKGDQVTERALHRHFAAHRLHGEWFRWVPEMATGGEDQFPNGLEMPQKFCPTCNRLIAMTAWERKRRERLAKTGKAITRPHQVRRLLSKESAAHIKTLRGKKSAAEIASDFGVSPHSIWAIWRGRRWKMT